MYILEYKVWANINKRVFHIVPMTLPKSVPTCFAYSVREIGRKVEPLYQYQTRYIHNEVIQARENDKTSYLFCPSYGKFSINL